MTTNRPHERGDMDLAYLLAVCGVGERSRIESQHPTSTPLPHIPETHGDACHREHGFRNITWQKRIRIVAAWWACLVPLVTLGLHMAGAVALPAPATLS